MYFVHLEVKRIQTYLFSIPKLKAMVGANVILGETLMGSVDDLDFNKPPETTADNFVKLAVRNNSSKKIGELFTDLEQYFDVKLRIIDEKEFKDDSPEQFIKSGILSRNGGHFSVIFDKIEDKEKFIKEAKYLISEKLPGIRLNITEYDFTDEKTVKEEIENLIDELSKNNGGEKKKREDTVNKAELLLPIELPQFAVCEGTGNDPASLYENKYNIGYISESYKSKIEAANRFYGGKSSDVVGELFKTGFLKRENFKDIEITDICKGGYLAVIHADGNNIRLSQKKFITEKLKGNVEEINKDFIENPLDLGNLLKWILKKEILREAFFYRMRNIFRNSVVSSVNTVFKDNNNYRIFMLGGDDLFFICDAKKAIDFIIKYSEEIKNKSKQSKNEMSFTIGAGLVIAHPKFPIFTLHHIAEELAGSAKQKLKLEKPDNPYSVIDWIVTTESNIGDIGDYKERHQIFEYKPLNERLILSNKPYKILGEKEDELSLKALWDYIKKPLSVINISRNKLKSISKVLREGTINAKILFDEFPEGVKSYIDGLKKMIPQNSIDNYWPFFMKSADDKDAFTYIPDVIELGEIENLKVKGNKDE